MKAITGKINMKSRVNKFPKPKLKPIWKLLYVPIACFQNIVIYFSKIPLCPNTCIQHSKDFFTSNVSGGNFVILAKERNEKEDAVGLDFK